MRMPRPVTSAHIKQRVHCGTAVLYITGQASASDSVRLVPYHITYSTARVDELLLAAALQIRAEDEGRSFVALTAAAAAAASTGSTVYTLLEFEGERQGHECHAAYAPFVNGPVNAASTAAAQGESVSYTPSDATMAGGVQDINNSSMMYDLNLLLLYTPEAVAASGSLETLLTNMLTAVNVGNIAYQNSHVNIQLNLVATKEVWQQIN